MSVHIPNISVPIAPASPMLSPGLPTTLAPTTRARPVVLRGGANHLATAVTPCEPWSYVPNVPPDALVDKPTFIKWRMDPSTSHLFYTATEAVNENIRPNDKTNPVRCLHGLIADYDAKISDEMLDRLDGVCASDMLPTWRHKTFSGGARLVWLFEEPLPLDSPALADQFLKVAKKQLRLEKLLPGLDAPAWENLNTLYEVGTDWQPVSTDRLTPSVLHYWLMEASKKVKWRNESETKIPLEVIAVEVDKRFPGRWSGPFEEGARGVVFFDPSSVNPTAAIVTEAGMVTFGQEKVFYPWGEIFGREFIAQHEANRIGAAVVDMWYDGKAYWAKSDKGRWWPYNAECMSRKLRVAHELDGVRGKRDNSSEVDKALWFIETNRRIDGVVPMIYDRRDVAEVNGKLFLNCAVVQPIQPVNGAQEWGVNFPWIAGFLDGMFDPPEQLRYLLAWWKRGWQSALEGELLKGHALFLVGGVNLGKTLLSTRMIGYSFGGCTDASDFLNSDTPFNKELMEVGCWNIDDGTTTGDSQAHRKFSEMVKRVVANPLMSYRAMYRDPQRTEWRGRLIVTLNDDELSVQILPDLAASMEEKVIILNCARRFIAFPDKRTLEDTIDREMPFFLRWLYDWQVPAELVGDHRLGVKSYIHEGVRAKALNSGGVSGLLELIEVWKTNTSPEEEEANKGGYWEGTASAWMAELHQSESLRPFTSKWTPAAIGRKFNEAARMRGSGVEVIPPATRSRKVGTRYRIRLIDECADVDPDRPVSAIEAMVLADQAVA